MGILPLLVNISHYNNNTKYVPTGTYIGRIVTVIFFLLLVLTAFGSYENTLEACKRLEKLL